MTQLISQSQLNTSLQKVKSYADNRANANVYRDEKQLWSGSFSLGANEHKTTFLTQTLNSTTTATSFWGTTETSKGVSLSQPVTNFDAIVLCMRMQTASGSNSNVRGIFNEVEIPIRDIYQPDLGRYFVRFCEFLGSSGANDQFAFSAGLGTTSRLHFNATTPENQDILLTDVYGIKYTPMEKYSYEEQKVGTWVDGKPVYQKTFNVQLRDTAASNEEQTAYSISVADLNIDLLIDTAAVLQNTQNGNNNPLPASNGDWNYRINLVNNNLALKVVGTTTSTLHRLYLTIKYIKKS